MIRTGRPESAPLVGILLFDGVEPLDFAGPLEVLACSRDPQGGPRFRVVTLGAGPPVLCAGGLVAVPQLAWRQAPALDVLLVPGGPGAREPDPDTLAAVAALAPASRLVTSVCTGSFILAQAGWLTGHQATTHHLRREEFARRFPAVDLVPAKIVESGAVVTAAGVSSGVDLGLWLLERHHGPQARALECARLEGPWT